MTPVPISALEHFSYCERQCGLIHLEACFIDNAWTARGTEAHTRVDTVTAWRGAQVLRALPLFSDRLGLVGRADVVILGRDGTPEPVEYKSGSLRTWPHETIQLCAQALCLQEMFHRDVPRGMVYYATSRRRRQVPMSDDLIRLTNDIIRRTRAMMDGHELPPARHDRRCRNCSLQPACLPNIVTRRPQLAEHEQTLRAYSA
jgi:CRISPR-associated exonuclease Cas4